MSLRPEFEDGQFSGVKMSNSFALKLALVGGATIRRQLRTGRPFVHHRVLPSVLNLLLGRRTGSTEISRLSGRSGVRPIAESANLMFIIIFTYNIFIASTYVVKHCKQV